MISGRVAQPTLSKRTVYTKTSRWIQGLGGKDPPWPRGSQESEEGWNCLPLSTQDRLRNVRE